MRRHRANTASTHNAHTNIVAARADVNSMSPTQEVCSLQEMFCFAALANANTGMMYTDLTGAFPVRSFKNMQYIFVAYIYDLNTIIVQPMPSCANAAMIATFTEVFAVLWARDYQPALNVIQQMFQDHGETHLCQQDEHPTCPPPQPPSQCRRTGHCHFKGTLRCRPRDR
jgi:hypothetical protein